MARFAVFAQPVRRRFTSVEQAIPVVELNDPYNAISRADVWQLRNCPLASGAILALGFEEVIVMLSTPILAEDKLDSVQVDPSHHQVLFENDQVRVLRWFVAAGDTTLNHSHPDNLNICLTAYNGKVTMPDAKVFSVRAQAGSVSWRQAGSHAVENRNNQPMVGIIVEPKQPDSRRPAGSPDPVAVDPAHHKVEFENEQIRVLREHRDPGDLPLHGHPDSVQVLLTNLNATLTTADGIETFTGKAGDVRWRPATQHTGTVLGEKPVEQILVEMKGQPAPAIEPVKTGR